MPKRLFCVNNIMISASFLVSSDNACIFKMGNDSHGGALCYAHTAGNIPHTSARIFCQADQRVRVVA